MAADAGFDQEQMLDGRERPVQRSVPEVALTDQRPLSPGGATPELN